MLAELDALREAEWSNSRELPHFLHRWTRCPGLEHFHSTSVSGTRGGETTPPTGSWLPEAFSSVLLPAELERQRGEATVSTRTVL